MDRNVLYVLFLIPLCGLLEFSLIQSELSDMFSVIKYPEGFRHVTDTFYSSFCVLLRGYSSCDEYNHQ